MRPCRGRCCWWPTTSIRLDITALHAARFCRFVSKADVKAWPLIGALASGVGTLFIQRESRRDAMRVVHHMADRCCTRATCWRCFPKVRPAMAWRLLPFHANLLQAAITAQAPVQPVALRLIHAQRPAQSGALLCRGRHAAGLGVAYGARTRCASSLATCRVRSDTSVVPGHKSCERRSSGCVRSRRCGAQAGVPAPVRCCAGGWRGRSSPSGATSSLMPIRLPSLWP